MICGIGRLLAVTILKTCFVVVVVVVLAAARGRNNDAADESAAGGGEGQGADNHGPPHPREGHGSIFYVLRSSA